MERLIRGYREFRKKRWPLEHTNYQELARKGQRPEYLLIACSDSRSDPANIFGARPGEFFVVRNIAALVPPYEAANGFFGTRAAIAYAVLVLEVRNIVVMGHGQCAGVATAVDADAARDIPFVREWVDLLKPAVERSPPCGPGLDGCAEVERNTIILSVERLLAYPFVAERVNAGRLAVDGGRFSIADGIFEVLNRRSGKFETVRRSAPLSRWFGGSAT